MSRQVHWVFYCFFALAIAGIGNASAQDWTPPDAGSDSDADSDADSDTDSDTDSKDTDSKDGTAPDADSDVTGMTLATYPAVRILRPRVLPHMVLQAHGEIAFSRFDFAGSSSSRTVLNFGTAIGLMQGKAEAGFRTDLTLDPETVLGKRVELSGAYSLVEETKMGIAGELKIDFDFNDGADTFGGFSLGARGIYRLNDKMALLGGGNTLAYDVESDHLDLNVEVGFLYQFTDEFSGEAHTQIASLGLSGDLNGSAVIFADSTPLTFTGYWSSESKLDAWMSFGFNLNHIADFQQLAVGIAYRFGL